MILIYNARTTWRCIKKNKLFSLHLINYHDNGTCVKIKNKLTKELIIMTQTKIKKATNISPVENVKLFQACEVNDTRKNYNKLWTSVKGEAIEIVERVGGSIISKYKSKAFYMEIAKKNTKRFDVTSFKEKHPQLYESFLIDGEAVELKTKVVK